MFGAYKALFAKNDDARSRLKDLVSDTTTSHQRKLELQTQVHVLKRKRSKKNLSKKAQELEILLERANLLIKPEEFMLFSFGLAGLGALIPFLFGWGWLLAIVGGVLGFMVMKLFLKIKIMLRIAKAEATFADVLAMMVTSFKSGLGFNKVTKMVADSFDDPWGTEFNKLTIELNFGSTQEEALTAMAKRIPTPDMDLFVAAMSIQKETGGNLVEILSILGATIRDRFKLKRKVGALTAQGKLSAVIVFLVPVLIGGLLFMASPSMMINFANSLIGKIALGFAFVLQTVGGIVLMKITNLEV